MRRTTRRRSARWRILRWDLTPEPVLYDFVAHVREARVTIADRPCRWQTGRPRGGGLGQGPMQPGARHQCDARRSWLWVGATVQEDLELLPRHCIWQHPAAPEVIAATFEDVPLGDRVVLAGDIYYEHERMLEHGPVEVALYLDGVPLGRMIHRDGDGLEGDAGLHADPGARRPRAGRHPRRGDRARPGPAHLLLGRDHARGGGRVSRSIGARDHLVGLCIAAAYVALLLVSSRELGMSRDEGFYVDAANRYAAWFEQLGEDPSAAVTPEAVQRGWEYNHEHPSLVKSTFALMWIAQQRWELFELPSMAYRFGGMLSGGLLLWLIYIFGARAYGRQAGIFAAFAFALMPRVFYHSQLDCFDIPIALALTAVAYCWWRSLTDWRWALVAGVVFGLALETKHNAWTLPAILWVHWVFVALGRRDRAGEPGPRRYVFMTLAILGPLLALGGTLYFGVLVPTLPAQMNLPGTVELALLPIPLYLVSIALVGRWARARRWQRLVPWGLVAMAVIGPVLFVALWPWMWFETADRFREYASFHLNHTHYNMAYFGENYFAPPMPIGFPWVMTLFTVPLVTIALALSGIVARARALLPPGLLERLWPIGRAEPDSSRTDVLMFGMLLAPMVVISMPWTPIFGGTKHWITAYPFLAIFSGIAYVFVARAVRERLPEKVPVKRYVASLGVATVLMRRRRSRPFTATRSGCRTTRTRPAGVPGAADHGMNRQFWGFTTGSLTGWFTEQMPEGGSVWICDTTWTAWRMLQDDGHLPSNIRASGDLYGADYAIVHHEHHFVEVDYQIWAAWGSVQPVHVLTYDGVPIVSVYENPRHRARRLRGGAQGSRGSPVR